MLPNTSCLTCMVTVLLQSLCQTSPSCLCVPVYITESLNYLLFKVPIVLLTSYLCVNVPYGTLTLPYVHCVYRPGFKIGHLVHLCASRINYRRRKHIQLGLPVLEPFLWVPFPTSYYYLVCMMPTFVIYLCLLSSLFLLYIISIFSLFMGFWEVPPYNFTSNH